MSVIVWIVASYCFMRDSLRALRWAQHVRILIALLHLSLNKRIPLSPMRLPMNHKGINEKYSDWLINSVYFPNHLWVCLHRCSVEGVYSRSCIALTERPLGIATDTSTEKSRELFLFEFSQNGAAPQRSFGCGWRGRLQWALSRGFFKRDISNKEVQNEFTNRCCLSSLLKSRCFEGPIGLCLRLLLATEELSVCRFICGRGAPWKRAISPTAKYQLHVYNAKFRPCDRHNFILKDRLFLCGIIMVALVASRNDRG